MKEISVYLKNLGSSYKKDLKIILPQLDLLRSELSEIYVMSNRIVALVYFFKVISPLQDADGFKEIISKLEKRNYGQLDLLIGYFKELQRQVNHSGRNLSGINRTNFGEPVTFDNIWLGNIFDLPAKPARILLNNQKKLQNTKCGTAFPKNAWYYIHDYQCGSFVVNTVLDMLAQIREIKNFCS